MSDFSQPHKTAIKRTNLSAPAQYLEENDLLNGRCLDYGCGYGVDAAILGMEMYDPYYHPELPSGKFDTIMCNYVLNVVLEEEGLGIIKKIESLLKPGGSAYITVRRDVDGESIARQRLVKLDLPVECENVSFCMYETW